MSFCRRGARVFVGSGAVCSQLYVEDDREKSPTQEELETLLRSAGVGAGAVTVGTGESRSTCLSLEFCVCSCGHRWILFWLVIFAARWWRSSLSTLVLHVLLGYPKSRQDVQVCRLLLVQ